MEQLVCLSKAGVGYVGVNLGCGDRCVSEKFLNDTDISAISKECGCKWMSESMGWDIFCNICPESTILDHIRDKESRKTHVLIAQIMRWYISDIKIMANEEGWKMVTTSIDILNNNGFCFICEVDHAKLGSFSSDTDAYLVALFSNIWTIQAG